MGQTFLTSAGKKITLGKQLGSGGSATVYLTNQKGKIAKIFHLHVIKPNMEPRLKFMVNDFKTGKIQTNLTWKDGYKQQIFTWPEEVLYNSKGEFSGFIREDLGGDNDVIRLDYIIKDYYYGKQKWKGFNKLKNKYILAQRLAEVFARFYQEENYQNGDIKPENLMVNKNGYPIIFDIDNVSIKQGKKWLIPDVKMNTPNYRAPEWSEYDVNSDYFTIAVIFYQLLFKLHPYDGGTTTYGELLVPQSIIKGLYVHGPKRSSYIKPHEEHDAILLLPKEIRDLFYRAFCGAANTRPKPAEWASVLLKNMNSIQFNAINKKLQPAPPVKIKKRSTRKKKSTGTLFTPKTTSATVQKPSGKLSKKINYFKVPMAIRALLLAGFIILAFMYITNQGSNLWDSSTDVKEDQSYQEFLKDHKVLHYFLYSKHDGRFENTGSSYEPFMLLKRGAGNSGFDIVILETTGNTKTIYHNGSKSLMDFTYTDSYTYLPSQSHYVTMKKEDFYKEMLVEIKYMEADYDSWVNQETQYAYINEYYLYNSVDDVFGKDPRLDLNAELHPEKNWKYKEYFKNRELNKYQEEIGKLEEEINNIEKSHLIEEPNNNSYREEPLEDFEQKEEPEEDDEAPKDEEPEKNKEEILFDKISSLKNKGYNFKKIGIELSITKKEAKAIYKKYN